MARSGSSLREQQNSPGQSTEPSRFSFFKLPPELRTLVYKHYFSYEELPLDPYLRFPYKGPPDLVLKGSLLRSSTVILNEALPVFYQYYLFRIQVPDVGSLKFPPPSPPQIRRSEDIRYLTPVLPLINRLELVEPRVDLLNGSWDMTMAPYLRCLLDYCTSLRFLRFHIFLEPVIIRQAPTFQAHVHSKTFRLLAQLIKRLDRLEMIFVRTAYCNVSDLCKDIAPETCWTQEAFIEVPGSKLQTSFWSLDRVNMVLEDVRTS